MNFSSTLPFATTFSNHASRPRATRVVHLRGLPGQDGRGGLDIDAGLARQTESSYLQAVRQLRDLGVSLDDVSHVKVYVKAWSAQDKQDYSRGVNEASRMVGADLSWPTLVLELPSLSDPALHIELEVVALVYR